MSSRSPVAILVGDLQLLLDKPRLSIRTSIRFVRLICLADLLAY